MALEQLAVKDEATEANRTTIVHELFGSDGVSRIQMYACPQGKRAWVEILYYGCQGTGQSLSLFLLDPKAKNDPTDPAQQLTYTYTVSHEGWTVYSADTSQKPWNDDFRSSDNGNNFVTKLMPLFSGQSIEKTIGGNANWRLVYKIIEEDLVYV